MFKRQQACFMTPVLKKTASLFRIAYFVEKLDRIGAEPGKNREIVRPHQDVHRINLEHPDAPGDGVQVPVSDPAR